MPRLGVQGPVFASSRAVILGVPGAFLLDRSSGLFSFRRRSRHGPSGPRRKCGVRRREPLCGATGVYQIKGAPAALCAVGSKKEMVGTEAPLVEGVRSAAYGRKEKLGPLRGKKVVRLRRGKKTAPQAEACGAAVIHFFKKNCGKIFYWGYLIAACAAFPTKAALLRGPRGSDKLRSPHTEAPFVDAGTGRRSPPQGILTGDT